MKPVISLKGVSKSFNYWEDRPTSIKQILTQFSSGKFGAGKKRNIEVLKDITFDIYPGDFVGIMGHNGAGKSTILKMISGIYTPTEGEVIINGAIAPLLELGAGFTDELSGYDNIFLNAAILGFGFDKTKQSIDSIIEFSELGERIHSPVRNYSSGMMIRLAFSIAVHLDAPILLFDEVLAVGDVAFQEKCMNKIRELHSKGRSIILVTHSPEQIAQFCNSCIVIANKTKVYEGPPREGIEEYIRTTYSKNAPKIAPAEDAAVLRSVTKRAMVFAHYDKNGIIQDYVIDLLKQYKNWMQKIIFVSTSELSSTEREKLQPFTDTIVTRENRGYDFYSWKVGISYLNLADYDELVITNDSCRRTEHSFDNLFLNPLFDHSDFWGITNSFEFNEHVQSYFVAFRKRVFLSEVFKNFWDNMNMNPASKDEVIEKCEIRMTQDLLTHNFSYNVLIDARRINNLSRFRIFWLKMRQAWPFFLKTRDQMAFSADSSDFSTATLKKPTRIFRHLFGAKFNPSLIAVGQIMEKGCPLVKRKVSPSVTDSSISG